MRTYRVRDAGDNLFRGCVRAGWRGRAPLRGGAVALFDPSYLRGDKTAQPGDTRHARRREGVNVPASPEAARNFAAIPAVLDAFAPVIERNRELTTPARRNRGSIWRIMRSIARDLARALQARAEGDVPTAQAALGRGRRLRPAA